MLTRETIRDRAPTWARFGALGQARRLAYRGAGAACPCCAGSFRALRPHRGRREAKCPKCGSLERHRLLWLYLARRTTLLVDALDVLHIAPEYCFERRLAMLPALRYTTADLDSPLAALRLDVMAMALPDQAFDVVLCNHVLEHVTDDRRAMREIHRVLRPGGWAILLVPIDRSRATTLEDPSVTSAQGRLRRYGQEDHARRYGRDYPERLRATGFTVTEENYGTTLPEESIARYRLRRDGDLEVIYRCDRPPA